MHPLRPFQRLPLVPRNGISPGEKRATNGFVAAVVVDHRRSRADKRLGSLFSPYFSSETMPGNRGGNLYDFQYPFLSQLPDLITQRHAKSGFRLFATVPAIVPREHRTQAVRTRKCCRMELIRPLTKLFNG